VINFKITRVGHIVDVPRQAAFALSKAMNAALVDAQTAQRGMVRENFVDRTNRNFLRNLVKIGPGDRATRDRLEATVRIIGPEGSESAGRMLARHEDGGVQTPNGVGYSIDPSVRIGNFWTIPTEAIRPTFASRVPGKLYPKALHLIASRDVVGTRAAHVHRTARGVLQLKGDDRTFVLFGANGGGPIGIFQRSGSRKFGGPGRSGGRKMVFARGGNIERDDIRLIWSLVPQVTLKPRLFFFSTVGETVRRQLPDHFREAFAQAMATAR
jgi:hypothetical protein